MAESESSSSPTTRDPLQILHELNSDFQRSKKEQIDRFLRDQEDLNRRFNECALNSDDERNNRKKESLKVASDTDDDDDDDDDVESQFNLRLDTFRVRPLSARIGSWALDDVTDNNNLQIKGSLMSKTHRSEGGKSEDIKRGRAMVYNNIQRSTRKRSTDRDSKETTDAHSKFLRNRERSNSRERRVGAKQAIANRKNALQTAGHRDRAKSKERNNKTTSTKKEDNQNSTDQSKLLKRRRHRPRTAMGLQLASRQGEAENTPTDEDCMKASTMRPMRASAPAAPMRQKISWEGEEMKRSTYMERQLVRDSTSSLSNTLGGSVTALQQKSRQQELLASASLSATAPSSDSLRQSLNFPGTPRNTETSQSLSQSQNVSSWSNISTPRLSTTQAGSTSRSTLKVDQLIATPRTTSNGEHTSNSSTNSKSMAHRKVGVGGPSEGGAVKTKISLIKLPRLEGNTLSKTVLHPSNTKEHTLVTNSST